MIIAVDFDGTLVDHRYPDIGNLKPGAREAMMSFKKAGHKIAIWTCRIGKEEQAVRQFLIQNDIPFDSINTAVPGTDTGTRKIYADVYIDDKAVRFEDNWAEMKRLILG
jgi:hydroxymethylpyrimidine pyrophosphatase-like HAD family hydrolase